MNTLKNYYDCPFDRNPLLSVPLHFKIFYIITILLGFRETKLWTYTNLYCAKTSK